MTGILIVDKPAGWTSQDVAAKLRSVFHERRVGHGGTLDPMATGVLPVFLGRATRAVPFFEAAEKEYIAELRLGCVTDTQDITGTVLETRPVRVTEAQLRAALAAMTGEQLQTPPMYSAVKIGGKKLYEIARAGGEIERPARRIELKELELLSFEGERAVFRVRCSKGTYVRTICHDLGERLGCGGCMAALRRTRAGRFSEAEAYPLERILAGEARVLPVESLFAELPETVLTAEQERRCRCGNPIPAALADGEYRVFSESGEFLLLGRAERGTLYTVKSFFEVQS